MSFLSSQQRAAIKTVRARAWNTAFELWTYPPEIASNMWEPVVGTPTVEILSGDWRWGDQIHNAFRTGGVIEEGDAYLACDVTHGPKFRAAAVRVKIDEQLCMVVAVTDYPGSGEVVVHARRIQGGSS